MVLVVGFTFSFTRLIAAMFGKGKSIVIVDGSAMEWHAYMQLNNSSKTRTYQNKMPKIYLAGVMGHSIDSARLQMNENTPNHI